MMVVFMVVVATAIVVVVIMVVMATAIVVVVIMVVMATRMMFFLHKRISKIPYIFKGF